MEFHEFNCTGFSVWGKIEDRCPGETEPAEEPEEEPAEENEELGEIDVDGNPIPTASDSYD